MTKDEFIKERTRIISEMLDNPTRLGIFHTGRCFAELDDLFDKMNLDMQQHRDYDIFEPVRSEAQITRDGFDKVTKSY